MITNPLPSFHEQVRWMRITSAVVLGAILIALPTLAETDLEVLEGRLEGTRGAERVALLLELAEAECFRAAPDAARHATEAAHLASTLGDVRSEARGYKLEGVAETVIGDHVAAIASGRHALTLFEGLDDRPQVATLLNNLGIAYRMLDRSDEALDLYAQSLAIERALDNPAGIARTLGNIANVHFDHSRYAEALATHQEELAIVRQIGDLDAIASSLANIGITNYEMGRLDSALDFQLQALTLNRETGDRLSEARNLSNVANIEMDLERFDDALDHYEQALVVGREVGSRELVSSSHLSIGNVLVAQGEYGAAIKKYQTALPSYEELDDRGGIADVWDGIGVAHRGLGQLEEAVDDHLRALAIREEIGGERALANTCNDLGRLYVEMGRATEAAAYLERGLALAREVGALEMATNALWEFSRVAVARGDYRGAVTALEEHIAAKDELLGNRTRDRMAELETRYEADRREREIELLQKENEIRRLEADRATLRTKLVLVGAAALLAVVLWLGHRYRSLLAFWKRRSWLGHYRLLHRIGSGGMGVVYRARDSMDRSRTVALKVIREEQAADPSVRKRFLHEAAIVDQLDHPHLATVYERGEAGGRLFIAMELLEGSSLAEIIAEGRPLPVDTCLHIASQLIEVVAEIHAKGVLHRDLKPDNIVLVERDGDPFFVKLLDFGLARTQSLTRLTESGTILGTIGYLAPEQITDQHATAASDLYAVGVICYEMLSRRHPFPGATPVETIQRILAGNPPPPSSLRPEIPAELDALVLGLLAVDPGLRPSAATITAKLARLRATKTSEPPEQVTTLE
jgi:tetratricopeptide (TPR) repeat protein